jgi:Holliday junction resolvase RusA-like endonuclease
MTQRDKWLTGARKRPEVVRYHAFCDEVKAAKITLGPLLECRFFIPMPKSWSKKKKLEMGLTPHQSKPDLSNLVKALEDAACVDDSHIWCYKSVGKFWHYTGAIDIKY